MYSAHIELTEKLQWSILAHIVDPFLQFSVTTLALRPEQAVWATALGTVKLGV